MARNVKQGVRRQIVAKRRKPPRRTHRIGTAAAHRRVGTGTGTGTSFYTGDNSYYST